MDGMFDEDVVPLLEETTDDWTQVVAGADPATEAAARAAASAALASMKNATTPAAPRAPLPAWKIGIGVAGLAVVMAGMLSLLSKIGRR